MAFALVRSRKKAEQQVRSRSHSWTFGALFFATILAGCFQDSSESGRSTASSGAANSSNAKARDADQPPAPLPPSFTLPSTTTYRSNTDSLSLSGRCSGVEVLISSATSAGVVPCLNSTWSFTVSEAGPDGDYPIWAQQTNTNGQRSPTRLFIWNRDKTVNAPVLSNPPATPYASGDSIFNFVGDCEAGATVTLGGDDSQTGVCDGSGHFSFSFTPTTSGNFNFTFQQTDLAGNVSATVSQQWTRLSGVPATPTILVPTSSSSYWTNVVGGTVSGTCTAGLPVRLFGGTPPQDMNCNESGGFSFNVSFSSDGDYLLYVKQTDSGVDSAYASLTWHLDRVPPPTLSGFTSPASEPYTSNSDSITISGPCETFSTIELTGADSQTVSCSGSPGSYTILTADITADGPYSFVLKQIDRAGNASDPTTLHWTRDTTIPASPVITSPAPGTRTNGSIVHIQGTCDSAMTVILGGASAAEAGGSLELACTLNSFDFTVDKSLSSDQTFTFTVQQRNWLGTLSAVVSRAWTLDRVAPAIPARDTPTGNSVINNTGSLTVEGDCELDANVTLHEGASTETYACTSSLRYSFTLARPPGSYTITIDQTDVAGNTSSATPALSWTYDNSVPNPPVLTAPNPLTNTPALTFTGTCDAGMEVVIVSGASDAEVTSPASGLSAPCSASNFSFTLSEPSASAVYTVVLKQRNAAGTYSATGATLEWTVDLDPPDTSITAQPAANTNTGVASFSFTSTAVGATFECQVDGGGYTSCSDPFLQTGFSDGSHTFEVRSIDPATNTDPTAASYTWNVDTIEPNTVIDTGPSGSVNNTNANLAFSSNELGTTFECQLDGGSFASCSSPHALSALSEGSHTLLVRARDSAGNIDSSPASQTWTVDTIAPETTIDSGPSGTSGFSTATFAFSSSQSGSTFECRLDGAAFTSCGSPASYSGLADGSHTFDVRSTDAAGNLDASPASASWTIDTSAPDTQILTAPPATSNSTSSSFTFNSNDPSATFECSIDGAAYANCTSPQGYAGLSDGSHTFEVKAIDSSANPDPTPASLTWTIDTAAPETLIDSGMSGSYIATSATFSFSSSQTGSTFECQLDAAAYSACVSPISYSSLSSGSHTFSVRAIDPAGNVDPSSATNTWSVENYNTVSLFHFDTGAELTDSTLFTGANRSALSAINTVTQSTTVVKVGSASEQASLTTSSSTTGHLSAPHNSAHASALSKMTIEGWFQVTTVPSNAGDYLVLASKWGASGDRSWQVRVKKHTDGKTYLFFVASTDGTTTVETTPVTGNPYKVVANTWYHFAAVFNAGAMTIYRNGTAVGSATASGSALHDSTTALRLGTDGSNYAISSTMSFDEIRYSRTNRYTSSFTAPTTAFTAD